MLNLLLIVDTGTALEIVLVRLNLFSPRSLTASSCFRFASRMTCLNSCRKKWRRTVIMMMDTNVYRLATIGRTHMQDEVLRRCG